jgi:hypothetical protein
MDAIEPISEERPVPADVLIRDSNPAAAPAVKPASAAPAAATGPPPELVAATDTPVVIPDATAAFPDCAAPLMSDAAAI